MSDESSAVDSAVNAQHDLDRVVAEWEEWQRLRAAAVLEAIDRGLTPTAVAHSLGVTVPAARAIYQRADAQRRYEEEERESALAALREVGTEFQAVTSRYEEAVAAREAAVAAAIEQGISAPHLAENLGIVRQQVGAIARRARQQKDTRNTEAIPYIA